MPHTAGTVDPENEKIERDIRDQVCGEVSRAVAASVGRKCTGLDVDEVVDQLETIRGVSVPRWEDADDRHDNRDFIDLTTTRSTTAGQMFLILGRNGFVPEAMAGNWEGGTPDDEKGRVVLQWKR